MTLHRQNNGRLLHAMRETHLLKAALRLPHQQPRGTPLLSSGGQPRRGLVRRLCRRFRRSLALYRVPIHTTQGPQPLQLPLCTVHHRCGLADVVLQLRSEASGVARALRDGDGAGLDPPLSPRPDKRRKHQKWRTQRPDDVRDTPLLAGSRRGWRWDGLWGSQGGVATWIVLHVPLAECKVPHKRQQIVPNDVCGSNIRRHQSTRAAGLMTPKSYRNNTPRQGVGGGGGLQPVLMRHPPQLSSKTCGGGGVGGRVGGGGVNWQLGRGGGAARDPLLPHAYLKGVCVSGGIEVCMR